MKDVSLPLIHPKSEDSIDQRRQAVSESVDAYGLHLLNYAMLFINDRHLAEDAVQTLWLDAFKRFTVPQINDIGLLKHRLIQIIINELRRFHNRFEIPLESLECEFPADDWLPEPVDDEDDTRLWERFWSYFDSLELIEEEKQGFWLKARYGYSIKEIAKRLDVPYATVGGRLKKVRDKCMEYLNGKRYE
jgi:RNA polymerase sigma factor (sigma-70 family)